MSKIRDIWEKYWWVRLLAVLLVTIFIMINAACVFQAGAGFVGLLDCILILWGWIRAKDIINPGGE